MNRAAMGKCFKRILFFAAVVCCALLSGGQARALDGGGDPGKIDPFGQAEFQFRAGNFAEAQGLYHDFLSRYPTDRRAEQALLRLGQIESRNGSYITALRYFNFVLNSFPNAVFLHQIKFELADCAFHLGRYGEAESVFREELKLHPDVKKRWEAALYLGRIDEKRGDYSNAIIKLNYVHGESPYEDLKDQASGTIEELVEEKLSKMAILSLARKVRGDFPLDLLLLKLQSIYRAEGDRENYQASLEEFLTRLPRHPLRDDIERKLAQVKAARPKVIRLGAVLPLTGKYALTGQQVLQGIQLAWNQLPPADKQKLELAVKNSGDSQAISQVVEELAADPSVVGIIGPVLSADVMKISPLAKKYRIPVFTPTASSPDLLQPNSYVFRNALTKEIQGKYLARHAFNNMGLRRFAVLYPEDPYGVELKEIFSRAVQSLGGEIVAAVSYNRKQTDFKEQILQIGGMPDGAMKKLANQTVLDGDEPAESEGDGHLSRIRVQKEVSNGGQTEGMKVSLVLNYDAVFMPGFYDKVGLIAPQLAFYNIDNVALLGASGWNSPELPKIAGKFLKNGVFVDGFFLNSPDKHAREFVNGFKTTFAEDPTIISAQAYDAARMIMGLIRNGATNRVAVDEQLRTVKDFPGVSGKTAILASGESEKTIFALKLKGGKIVQPE
ncbi:MAG: penicillin-binding protein activator [Nitrospinae bacterium]|nr:penicillin-binding protein activator [Nitrospinota bacterium]